ncbi:MAG TPA: nucleoside/nucleotide kinase family protein [Candidatus Lustribacter sp.]|nr:nucleoside/nucleotide kinase family protein [Candidatus Lustribacter sp.]
MELDALARRARSLVPGTGRAILGICGAPGSGKSTLAARLVAEVNRQEGTGTATQVPMDGFHLADVALDRLGLRDLKGAPETFDALGYAALLRRLREESDTTVYAPGFERDLEQPIAGAIAVAPDARLVVTEGNYLLLADNPWPRVRSALDECWYVETEETTRVQRLVARHIAFGKSPEAARVWVRHVDEPNAALVRASRGRADLVVALD